jgi:hypothetical protein
MSSYTIQSLMADEPDIIESTIQINGEYIFFFKYGPELPKLTGNWYPWTGITGGPCSTPMAISAEPKCLRGVSSWTNSQPAQQQEEDNESVSSEESVSDYDKYKKIAIISAVVLSIGIAGYYLYKSQKKSQ